MLFQVGTTRNSWVIDARTADITPILPYLSSYRWKKIFQRGKFDQSFIWVYYKTRVHNIWDTYVAEKVLNPDSRSNSLEALVLKYLHEKRDKSVRLSFLNHKGDFTQKQIDYAAQDVIDLFPIMRAQEEKGVELNLLNILNLEFELTTVVTDMEVSGVPIDAALWKSKIKHFEDLHEQSRLKMHEIFFDDGKMDEQLGLFARDSIKLGSPKQVKEAFHKLGINVDSTSEREISLLKHPAARELLNYREYDKILTAYGKSFVDKIHPFTQRIHPDWGQLGTETGRFSCREPNMQQVPEFFHECITLPGHMLVTADYSQIELRILAQLSDDPNMIKAFTSGQDLHKATASMMFGRPIDEVTKEQRFIAKTINFGISYGMGTRKLMDTLNSEAFKNGTPTVKFPQVQDMLNRYHRTYRKVTEWLAAAGALAFRQGFSETMVGRKRFYTRPDLNMLTQDEFDNQVAAIRRKGANSPIQGTNADITKMAMIAVFDEIQDAGYTANIILQVHDEVVILAQKNHAEAVKFMLEETMRKTAEKIITKVPVKADAVVSTSWNK